MMEKQVCYQKSEDTRSTWRFPFLHMKEYGQTARMSGPGYAMLKPSKEECSMTELNLFCLSKQ